MTNISLNKPIDPSTFLLDETQVRIDTYREGIPYSSNKVHVRVTHIPTQVSAVCDTEYSTYRAKQTAMAILRAKLHAIQTLALQRKIVDDEVDRLYAKMATIGQTKEDFIQLRDLQDRSAKLTKELFELSLACPLDEGYKLLDVAQKLIDECKESP